MTDDVTGQFRARARAAWCDAVIGTVCVLDMLSDSAFVYNFVRSDPLRSLYPEFICFVVDR
jgi:hypothetical protein